MHSLAAVAVLVAIFVSNVNAQSAKPHIVFIMADDLGWNDVSYHGTGEINTPNIDNLANDGVRLQHYYVSPSCGPTRSQFLSGRYTIHLGLHDSNLPQCTNDALPTEYNTIADELKTEGYSTHLIGKWHLGFHTTGHIPTSRGFDTFRGFLLSHGDHYNHTAGYGGTDFLDFHDNTTPYYAGIGTYSTTAFTDRAKELILAHNPDDPMFMYLSYQAPHSPLQVPDTFYDQYSTIPIDKRRYTAAMVTAMDDGVGQVVQALKDRGIYNNTVIIFSSDNGGANGAGSSFPLRGRKGSYFEGGIRAVGFVSSELIPVAQRNRDVSGLIHVTDWLPTMLNIAGDSSRFKGLDIDGVNQWNTIRRNATSRRTEILHSISVKKGGRRSIPFDESISACMIDGEYKILTGNHVGDFNFPNPKDDYTAWQNSINNAPQSTTTRLYNIFNDPNEVNDLSGTETEIKNNLLIKLRKHQKTMLDPIEDGNGLNCNPALRGGVWGPYA